MKKIIICFGILFIKLSAGIPQKPSDLTRHFQLGIIEGTGQIYGDFKGMKPGLAIGAFGNYAINKNYSFSIQAVLAQYKSLPAAINFPDYLGKGYKYNFALNSNINQVYALFQFRILPIIPKINRIGIFAQLGIGFASVHSLATYADMRDSIGAAGSKSPNSAYKSSVFETYDGNHLNLPLGMSLEYAVNNNIKLGFQWQYIFTRTDNIDLVNEPVFENKRFDGIGNFLLKMGYCF